MGGSNTCRRGGDGTRGTSMEERTRVGMEGPRGPPRVRLWPLGAVPVVHVDPSTHPVATKARKEGGCRDEQEDSWIQVSCRCKTNRMAYAWVKAKDPTTARAATALAKHGSLTFLPTQQTHQWAMAMTQQAMHGCGKEQWKQIIRWTQELRNNNNLQWEGENGDPRAQGPDSIVNPEGGAPPAPVENRRKRKANPPKRASTYESAKIKRKKGTPCHDNQAGTQDGGAQSAQGARGQSSMPVDIKALYEEMVPTQDFKPCLPNPPRTLRAQLRPYQSRGVSWMLWRETKATEEGREQDAESEKRAITVQCCAIAAQLIRQSHGKDTLVLEQEFMFDQETGTLFGSTEDGDQNVVPKVPSQHSCMGGGGILADEMGLGKSIELISCILLNPRGSDALKRDGDKRSGPTERTAGVEMPTRSTPKGFTDTSREIADAFLVDVESNLSPKVSDRIDPASFKTSVAAGPARNCLCGMPVDSHECMLTCTECGAVRHVGCIRHVGKPKAKGLQRSSFICGACTAKACGAFWNQATSSTLIICPASILEQWKQEFERHVLPNVLKVVVYNGQSQKASTGHFLGDGLGITASELGQADVVLTTYDALRHDLHLRSEVSPPQSSKALVEGPNKALRRTKRYEVIPTPLTRITWWRICLDEAQMIDSPTAQASAMALRLGCVHRWCITGTPVRRGLDDLFGLVSFLGPRLSPYSHKAAWFNLIQKPLQHFKHEESAYRELLDLLKNLMLRRSRESVVAELDLPSQGDITTYLRLSAVERHWYRKLHSQCINKSGKLLQKTQSGAQFNVRAEESFGEGQLVSGHRTSSPSKMAAIAAEERARGSFHQVDCTEKDERRGSQMNATHTTAMLSVGEEKKVLAPILALRQACCHPQVGVHGLKGRMSTGNVLGMGEIHSKLIDKACVEAEETQRLLFMTLNGMAALRVIEGDVIGSINMYREVLARSEQSLKQDNLRMDPLQKLHTLHNLSLLLREPEACNVAKTTRDATIELEEAKIRDRYISEFKSNLSLAMAGFEDVQDECNKLLGERPKELNTWWINILQSLTHNEGYQLMERLSLTMEDSWQGKSFPFSDLTGLQFTLQRDLDGILEKRNSVLSSLAKAIDVCTDPPQEEVIRSGNCEHCRDRGTVGVVCMNCLLDKELEEYEDLLYGKQMKSALPGRLYIDQADVGTGRNEPNSAEKCLRMLKSMMKNKRLQFLESISASGLAEHDRLAARTVDMLEALRKEYPRSRALSRSQSRYLGALDEVRMSLLRIRLRYPEETREHNGGIDPLPVHLRLSRLSEDEIPVLSTQYSQERLVYESELDRAKSQIRFLCSLRLGTGQTNECSVCRETMDDELSVFPCGHRLCMSCTVVLTKRVDDGLPFSKRTFFCPECRHRVHVNQINYIGQKSAIVGAEIFNVDLKQMFQNIPELKSKAEVADDGFQNLLRDLDSSTNISGSWGTKIDAIVKRVLLIQDGCLGDKILVFSEWQEVLDVVFTALQENAVRCVHVKSKKNLSINLQQFRRQEGPNVLLLPYAHGANGLNIVEAQHVVLVEPTIDPGIEAQAIKRVDRIGQTRTTCVHRFLIRDTVEENVHAVNHLRKVANRGGPDDVCYRRHVNLEEVQALLGGVARETN